MMVVIARDTEEATEKEKVVREQAENAKHAPSKDDKHLK